MNEILLVIGAALVILELFIPGGVAGTIGALISLYAITQLTDSMLGLTIGILAFLAFIGLVVYILLKLVSKDKFHNKLILNLALDSDSGFNSNKVQKTDMIGQRGITISVLKPAGKIKIAGEIYYVMSEDKFIDKDKQVEIVKVVNNEIFVREVMNG